MIQYWLKIFFNIYHEHKKYFFTFLLTGGITALIYFSTFALLWNIIHTNHIIAVSAGYFFGTLFHFFANKKITFKADDPQLLLQMFKYLILVLINYFITLIILQISLLFVKNPFIGLFLSAGATAVTGYLLFKFWIFKSSLPIGEKAS